jgi:hypothetical protein
VIVVTHKDAIACLSLFTLFTPTLLVSQEKIFLNQVSFSNATEQLEDVSYSPKMRLQNCAVALYQHIGEILSTGTTQTLYRIQFVLRCQQAQYL